VIGNTAVDVDIHCWRSRIVNCAFDGSDSIEQSIRKSPMPAGCFIAVLPFEANPHNYRVIFEVYSSPGPRAI
jgi:hypothetical protein